jgi:hypothetical protein
MNAKRRGWASPALADAERLSGKATSPAADKKICRNWFLKSLLTKSRFVRKSSSESGGFGGVSMLAAPHGLFLVT